MKIVINYVITFHRLQNAETFHWKEGASLAESNIKTEDWVNVFLVQPQELDSDGWEDNFTCEIQPYIEQTPKGMSFFAATLYVVVCIFAGEVNLHNVCEH